MIHWPHRSEVISCCQLRGCLAYSIIFILPQLEGESGRGFLSIGLSTFLNVVRENEVPCSLSLRKIGATYKGFEGVLAKPWGEGVEKCEFFRFSHFLFFNPILITRGDFRSMFRGIPAMCFRGLQRGVSIDPHSAFPEVFTVYLMFRASFRSTRNTFRGNGPKGRKEGYLGKVGSSGV